MADKYVKRHCSLLPILIPNLPSIPSIHLLLDISIQLSPFLPGTRTLHSIPSLTYHLILRNHGEHSPRPRTRQALLDTDQKTQSGPSIIISNAANVSPNPINGFYSKTKKNAKTVAPQLAKYMKLDQRGSVMAEYVWIDGTNNLRSKTKVRLRITHSIAQFALFTLSPTLLVSGDNNDKLRRHTADGPGGNIFVPGKEIVGHEV